MFKAKFFPHCSILDAKDSASGSHAWRSILRGRDVILEGVCWRVGNGRSIKIWQHHWLPIKHPTRITSIMLESMEEAIVECLINVETRSWNEGMIDGIFIPQEAELIKKIPLSQFEADDSIFWPLSPNGQYSCKLGYWFLRKEVDFNRLKEPRDYEKGLWKAVWSLNVPNKVKHLIWRACKNSPSTKRNIVRRQITIPVIDVQVVGKIFFTWCGVM